jgi:hypothetical protein
MRRGQVRTGKEVARSIIIKPSLACLETRDDRVASGCIVFRCMLTWRIIAAADVTTFGASAKMQPPTAGRQAFNTAGPTRLGRGINTRSLRRHVASGVVCAASLPPRSLRNPSQKFVAQRRGLSTSYSPLPRYAHWQQRKIRRADDLLLGFSAHAPCLGRHSLKA